MKTKFLIFILILLCSCQHFKQGAEELEAQRVADETKIGDSLSKVQAEQQRFADASVNMKPELAKDITLKTKTPAEKKLIKTAELKFQVGNVWKSTERIEDLIYKYDGYLTYSNLQNRYDNYSNINIKKDSLLIIREVIVENQIKLRIPNARLDSFIRELTPLVKYMDYRVIKIDDITFQLASIAKKNERFKNYEKRQTSHIDSNDDKLKDVSNAEDNLLDRQIQADEVALKEKELEDQLKYCNMTIEIYQKPIITKEVVADFNYVASVGPSFFVRLIDSIVQGFQILEEIILFVIKLWGIILIGFLTFIGVKYLVKITRK